MCLDGFEEFFLNYCHRRLKSPNAGPPTSGPFLKPIYITNGMKAIW